MTYVIDLIGPIEVRSNMSILSVLEAPARISDAIKKASKATGTDFEFLLKTAARESNFKINARSPRSSATGLFQFIENTWLKTIKEDGHRFGLGHYARNIQASAKGNYYVPDATTRREILNLRNDPTVSAVIAGAYAQKNSEYMSAKLGRNPSAGELYAAHFLGPGDAVRITHLAKAHPNWKASSYFPSAAKSNPEIFYSRGRPRSLAQVYKILTKSDVNVKVTSASPDMTEGDWQLRINQARTKFRPLSAKANFKARDIAGNATGGIGAWETIVTPSQSNNTSRPDNKTSKISKKQPLQNTEATVLKASKQQNTRNDWTVRTTRSNVKFASVDFAPLGEDFFARISRDS